MLSNKKLNPIVTELYIRDRKLNISLVFITQSYFAVPKKYSTKFYALFFMKISYKRELQQIAFNHTSLILYKICTATPYSFLVIDRILASNNPLSFRKNL